MNNNKGHFKKGNQAAKKRGEKRSSFEVFNTAHTFGIPAEPKRTQHIATDFIRFGSDNLFPKRMSDLYRKSAISRSIIDSKRSYIVGEGFQSENLLFQNYRPNPNETLFSVFSKAVKDRLEDGNIYLEIVRDRRTGMVNIYHIDSTSVRYHKDRENVIIHPDWANYEGYKKFAKTLPLYPNFERIDGFERSCYHIKDYERNFEVYGVPSNIAGITPANINYKTNKWNESRIENGFHLSGILVLAANFSDEDAEEFDKKFDKKFIGEGNQGKVLKIVNPLGGEKGQNQYFPMQTNEDGHWPTLHEQAINELIIANQWFASLAGINVSSGFDTNRIVNDYEQAMSNVVAHEQRVIIEAVEKILNEQAGMNIDDLDIIDKVPFSLVDTATFPEALIKLGEAITAGTINADTAREALMYTFKMKKTEADKYFV